jgi:hypothetical protein
MYGSLKIDCQNQTTGFLKGAANLHKIYFNVSYGFENSIPACLRSEKMANNPGTKRT